MNPVAYVMDTSYLLELFGVPGSSETYAMQEVRRRYQLAVGGGNQIYVPVPCIFELGNHIADVGDGRIRRELANKLYDTVVTSVNQSGPWTIIPAGEVEFLQHLSSLSAAFAVTYAQGGIGMTDTATIREAIRLKRQYTTFSQIHIWTRDVNLKAHEPDTEGDAFVR